MKKMGNFNVCAPTHTSQAIFIVGDTLEEDDEGFWHIMLVVVTEGRSIRSRYAVFCSNIINILINTMLLIKTVVTNVHSQCLVIVHCSLITKLCISSSC